MRLVLSLLVLAACGEPAKPELSDAPRTAISLSRYMRP